MLHAAQTCCQSLALIMVTLLTCIQQRLCKSCSNQKLAMLKSQDKHLVHAGKAAWCYILCSEHCSCFSLLACWVHVAAVMHNRCLLLLRATLHRLGSVEVVEVSYLTEQRTTFLGANANANCTLHPLDGWHGNRRLHDMSLHAGVSQDSSLTGCTSTVYKKSQLLILTPCQAGLLCFSVELLTMLSFPVTRLELR